MVKRPWDPNNRYAQGFLKSYRYWILELSFHQHTLGSFIIFSRINVEHFSSLKQPQLRELVKIMQEMEQALSKSSLKPDRLNYCQMGNNLHRLHFHGIPRYKKARTLYQKTWKDATFGKLPTFQKKEASSQLITNLKSELLPYLIRRQTK